MPLNFQIMPLICPQDSEHILPFSLYFISYFLELRVIWIVHNCTIISLLNNSYIIIYNFLELKGLPLNTGYLDCPKFVIQTKAASAGLFCSTKIRTRCVLTYGRIAYEIFICTISSCKQRYPQDQSHSSLKVWKSDFTLCKRPTS